MEKFLWSTQKLTQGLSRLHRLWSRREVISEKEINFLVEFRQVQSAIKKKKYFIWSD